MLNSFSRDIRSIRAQENIGVHSGAPLLVEHFSLKSGPYLWSDRRRRHFEKGLDHTHFPFVLGLSPEEEPAVFPCTRLKIRFALARIDNRG
jgi:hypothetical protein